MFAYPAPPWVPQCAGRVCPRSWRAVTNAAPERAIAMPAIRPASGQSNEPSPPSDLQLPPSARIDPPVHRPADLPPVFPQRIEFPGRADEGDGDEQPGSIDE